MASLGCGRLRRASPATASSSPSQTGGILWRLPGQCSALYGLQIARYAPTVNCMVLGSREHSSAPGDCSTLWVLMRGVCRRWQWGMRGKGLQCGRRQGAALCHRCATGLAQTERLRVAPAG